MPNRVPMDTLRSQYEMFSWHPLSDEAFNATTVLTRAILCEAQWKVRYLLRKGCDPNKPAGKNVIHPLMVACYVVNSWKRVSILKMLIEHGADPTKADVRGRNSVMYACALALAVETALMVKDWDYDFNTTDMYGDTLLHICARAGDARVLGVVLREMLKHRLDISIESRSGLTPLSIAVMSGNYECARVLYEAGASPRLPRLMLNDTWGGTRDEAITDLTSQLSWDKQGFNTRGLGRLKGKMPKLFSRVSMGSGSDQSKMHSGGRSRSAVVCRADDGVHFETGTQVVKCKMHSGGRSRSAIVRRADDGVHFETGTQVVKCKMHSGGRSRSAVVRRADDGVHFETGTQVVKCKMHSGGRSRSAVVRRADDGVQFEAGALVMSSVQCSRQRNSVQSTPPACLEGQRKDIRPNEKSASRHPRDDDAGDTAPEEESSHPASSLDVINAMLDSPAYKRRLTPSFSHPPSSTAPVDGEWIAAINTYNTKVEEIPLPIAVTKLRKASPKQRLPHNLSSTSSSASSSRSHLFRSKVMKHIITPRRMSLSPCSSSTTSFSSGSSRFKVPTIKLFRVPPKYSDVCKI